MRAGRTDDRRLNHRLYQTPLIKRCKTYAGRVLKAGRPGDLPVMRPVKIELIFNLQAARILGIDVPPALLAIADEVIE